MTKHVDLEFVLRVARVFDSFCGPSADGIWWRTDAPKYHPITIFVTCNDFFFWACSDMEEVTPENVSVLEACVRDMRALKIVDEKEREADWADAGLLFCARVRGMRPQGAYYAHIDKHWWPLFDACGPVREAETGNPKSRPVETVT